MTRPPHRSKPGAAPATGREARLKAALKANIARRKAQTAARARSEMAAQQDGQPVAVQSDDASCAADPQDDAGQICGGAPGSQGNG